MDSISNTPNGKSRCAPNSQTSVEYRRVLRRPPFDPSMFIFARKIIAWLDFSVGIV